MISDSANLLKVAKKDLQAHVTILIEISNI